MLESMALSSFLPKDEKKLLPEVELLLDDALFWLLRDKEPTVNLVVVDSFLEEETVLRMGVLFLPLLMGTRTEVCWRSASARARCATVTFDLEPILDTD